MLVTMPTKAVVSVGMRLSMVEDTPNALRSMGSRFPMSVTIVSNITWLLG
jgi:hypothetical protein